MSADASTSVTENALPLVNINGLLNYCIGGNTTLTATGGNTYLWSTGDVTDAITVTQGNYDVTATDANGCTGTASATVTEIANLIVNINGVLTHCPGSNTVLTAEGGTSYTWSNGSTTDSVVVTAGTYTVTATDATCTGTASVTVTELSTTPVSLGNDIAVCEDSSVTIDASNGYVSYLWNTGDTTQTLTPLTDGTYSITATDANGCTVADSVDVVFSPFPVVDLGIDTTIFAGSSYTLSPVITPAPTGNVNYAWQPDNVHSCANCATTIVTVEDTTVVTLVYTDAFGCVVSDSVVINTSAIVPIYIPNAFSPNKDGQNELFQIYGGAFKEFYMAIHNRWGQKVFESKDFTQAWDGTFKGKEQEQGVYVFYLKYVSSDLRINTLKGSVTLLR